MIVEDSSIEFDLFEDARQKLTQFLESEGHNQLEAERIAFYIIQGVRGVPKLLSLLNQKDECPSSHLRTALAGFVNNISLLNKANLLLNKNSDVNL